MESKKNDKQIIVNQEIFGTLRLIQSGLLGNFKKLMNKDEVKKSIENGYFNDIIMPYPFMFAPFDKNSQNIIKNTKNGEKIKLLKNDEIIGEIICESIFETDDFKNNLSIFNTNNIFSTIKQNHGKFAISGKFKIYNDILDKKIENVKLLKQRLNAKKITALFMSADPIHRAHERIIRLAIDKADFVLVFLVRSQKDDKIPYELRKKTMDYLAKNFFPQNRLIIVPFGNTHLFTGHRLPELECLVAKNFGATKIVIGQNHKHISMFYDNEGSHTILDRYKDDLNMETIVMPEIVYCNECRTLVSVKNCPHGQHHHTKYHTKNLRILLRQGLIPPSIFMRKEISAMILSELFPNRFKNLQKIYDELFPNNGILETHDEKQFYEQLMNLYQTSGLT